MSVLDSSNFNPTCWLFVFFTYDQCGVFLSSVFCELFILYKAYTIYLTRKNCFRYLKLMSPLNKWYYLKNNYLIMRSKDKVQRRSLRYATHRLMVMHPHTKYHWPISGKANNCGPDKLRWEEAEEVEAEEKIRLKQYVSLRSKGRHNNYWYFYLKLKCFPVFRFHCVSDYLPSARITIQFNSTYSFQANLSCQTVLWSWLSIIIKTYTNVPFKNKI
jgi:hypothetical protein